MARRERIGFSIFDQRSSLIFLLTHHANLQANDAETILTTGKYLNAVRECGKTVVCPWADSAPIEYDPTKRTHIECIEAAYRFASKVIPLPCFLSHLVLIKGRCELKLWWKQSDEATARALFRPSGLGDWAFHRALPLICRT